MNDWKRERVGEPGHRHAGNRYINQQTGEIKSVASYLRDEKYGGLSTKAFANLNSTGEGKRLIGAYSTVNGNRQGLGLAVQQLKQATKAKDAHAKRLALISFYPGAAYSPDSNYEDDDTSDDEPVGDF